MNEVLRNEAQPHSFSSRQLAAETSRGLMSGELTLGELEIEKLHKINEFLTHPELQNLVDEGKVTLGIIKPQANEGRGLPQTDEEAAQFLKQEIGEENIIFEFSTLLTDSEIDDFYSDVKERFSQIPDGHGGNVWDDIKQYMGSGPVTFMLLYREEGNAISWWREKMGKTRANEADPRSIRGRHAIQENLPNNLTHGSDSIESLKHELQAMTHVTEDLENKARRPADGVPSAELLSQLGVIPTPDDVISIERIFDTDPKGEHVVYGYEVTSQDLKGRTAKHFVPQKNVASMDK